MALVLNDRVKETSTSTGTGAMTLAGAAIGFITFATGIQGSNTTYYTIFNQGTSQWEVVLGTLNVAGNELTRTTVITSSDGGTAVTLNISCFARAEPNIKHNHGRNVYLCDIEKVCNR